MLTSSRLVNNILLAFLAAPRADSKRFEMLSILSTILSWDDSEREKAGLQKVGKGKAPPMRRKGSAKDVERSAEEEAAMNEVSSQSTQGNLLITVILKLVCRILDEGVVSGPGSRFSFSYNRRTAFAWYQVSTWLYAILSHEFRTCNAGPGQRACPPHVLCFEFIGHGSRESTSYWKKSELRPIRGIRRQNMIACIILRPVYLFSLYLFILNLDF